MSEYVGDVSKRGTACHQIVKPVLAMYFAIKRLLKVCLLGTLLLAAATGRAQTFNLIRSFNGLTSLTGFDSRAKLVSGPDGTLYGVTAEGGGGCGGTIFKMNPDGTGFTVLKYLFNYSTPGDGSFPEAGLLLDNGVLYGTTSGPNFGNIFKINTDGTGYTVLMTLGGYSGSYPKSPLIITNGVLFGTAYGGGTNNAGVVFRMNSDGSAFTVLRSFSAYAYNSASGVYASADGTFLGGGLALANGVLYGTTTQGGTNGLGTIFKMNSDGSGFAVLRHFSINDGGGSYFTPCLIGDTLYGATYGQGAQWRVYRIKTDGSGYTNLWYDTTGTNGSAPFGEFAAAGGVLYGTTGSTVYKIGTNGTGFATLKSFSFAGQAPNGSYTNSDGQGLEAGLALNGGVLFGTTSRGGTNGAGTIFRVNPDGSGFTNLFRFNAPDGTYPQKMIRDGSMVYGVTANGGSPGQNAGTVFKMNVDGGGYQRIKEFAANADGQLPVFLAKSGSMLYGVTYYAGNGYGLIFRMDTNGNNYSVIRNLQSTNGVPTCLFENNGVLYGSTTFNNSSGNAGGVNGTGSIFKMGIDGSNFSVIKSFAPILGYNQTNGVATNLDGVSPNYICLNGGAIYGVAKGGRYGYGTFFRLNLDGSGFTVLKNFPAYNASAQASPQKVIPVGNVFYGAYLNGAGTIFRINADGTGLNHIYDFSNGVYGASPVDIDVSKNVVYVSCQGGGTNGSGTVVQINTDGSGFQMLYDFGGLGLGYVPAYPASLSVVGNSLVGIAQGGGSSYSGLYYRLDLPIKPSLTNPPVGAVIFAGAAANLSVGADGATPLYFQWYSNSVPLATATNATLAFAPAAINHTGNYFVIVTNAYGSVTSSVVTLTVLAQTPIITSQPADQTLAIGSTASFAVAVTGVPPLGYRWYFNNGLYAGATNSSLVFGPSFTNQAGNYQVIITNLYGSATSRVAALSVLLQPNAYGIATVSASSLTLNLASTPGSTNRVWTSTNLALPIAQWQAIATNIAGTNGLFQVTDTNLASKPMKFYRVSTP